MLVRPGRTSAFKITGSNALFSQDKGSVLYNPHNLIPLTFNFGEHGIRMIRQARFTNHLYDLSHFRRKLVAHAKRAIATAISVFMLNLFDTKRDYRQYLELLRNKAHQ